MGATSSSLDVAWWEKPLGKVVPGSQRMANVMGFENTLDLLRHLPRTYQNIQEPTTLANLVVGQSATVVVTVTHVESRYLPHKRLHLVLVTGSDGQETLEASWFFRNKGQVAHRMRTSQPGTTLVLTGKVARFRDKIQLKHPEVADGDDHDEQWRRDHPWQPIYPIKGTVKSSKLEQTIRVVLQTQPLDELPDICPAGVDGVLSLPAALHKVHAPTAPADWKHAHRRFAFEEAFVLQTVLLRRKKLSSQAQATAFAGDQGDLLARFDQRLPFTLTAGQEKIGAELAAELAQTTPMNRLLQGDVGSGKTLVALRAMLQVVDSGGQCAMLAPTEVLAAQHARSIQNMLGDLAAAGMIGGADGATQVALLTGSLKTAARKKAMLAAASGDAGIVVGTHALIQDKVTFANLGMVVVDEQHRFGVDQRDALRAKASNSPHVLVMTATPIPRTVAMTVFGDLDVSTLTEVPAGRQEVHTHVVPSDKPAWVDRMWQVVREHVDQGRQVFVVCPRVGDVQPETSTTEKRPESDADSAVEPTPAPEGAGDESDLAAAIDVIDQLREQPSLQGLTLDLLHGKMKPEDKDRAMNAVLAGDTDVLVATTVIEVGVDVPNSAVMVILDADRFGISQLHQLRGRIGRGEYSGMCFLVTSTALDSTAMDRLQAVAATRDGFELAAKDLLLRREGNVLGAEQSGLRTSLQHVRVLQDADLIDQARSVAANILDVDPELVSHRALCAEVDVLEHAEDADYLERS